MEAKDLMIGDWVQVPSEIGRYKQICSTFDLDEAVLYKPIPLTPEILEKNGFKEDGEGVYVDSNSYFIPTYQSGFDIGTWETHIEPTKGIGDFSGKLKYVHQLQHALKLCGIEKEIILEVMEAPEKIYLTTDGDNSFVFTQKRSDNLGIEYIRKDVFIEKAEKWIKDNGYMYNGECEGDVKAMAEDFVNFMKGE